MSELDKRKIVKENNIRKTYRRPQLVAYGSLRDLTTGGSGNASEGEMGNAMPRP